MIVTLATDQWRRSIEISASVACTRRPPTIKAHFIVITVTIVTASQKPIQGTRSLDYQ
jgi:hypothetical protein